MTGENEKSGKASRRTVTGRVTSNKMDKTIAVTSFFCASISSARSTVLIRAISRSGRSREGSTVRN